MSGAAGALPTHKEVQSGLTGRCPRCGAGTLFQGPVRFAPRCRACGLDYSAFNVGDGPAAFLILIVGALVTALAITVELAFAPPAWVHVLLWLPFTTAAVILSLRLAKSVLLALEYKHRAAEGAVANGD